MALTDSNEIQSEARDIILTLDCEPCAQCGELVYRDNLIDGLCWECDPENVYEDEYDGQPTLYEEYQDLYGGDDYYYDSDSDLWDER